MPERPRLCRWRDPPVIGVALLMAAAGFAQFSPAAALADVAEHFGNLRDGDTVAEQAGLPGTVLGAGLAAIRLSALATLPLAAAADRRGRRHMLVLCISAGLACTAVAAASPGYWWFVLAVAVARPLLTATDTIGEVMTAEYTASSDRAKALALIAAAYGIGAGVVAVLRGAAGDRLGFRAVFALPAVLLLLVAAVSRRITEPDRFQRPPRQGSGVSAVAALRALGRPHRQRLAAIAGITFAAGFITGPTTTLLFVYAENVRDVSTAVTAALVVAAGATGLAGLVVGRFLADRVGRRPTGACALVLLAGAGLLTYAGSDAALVAGYPLGVFVGTVFGIPALALSTELFPTPVRASVAGWLVVAGVLGATSGLLLAGAIADVTDSFAAAMAVVCVPGGLASLLFALVPETRDVELEQSARLST